MISLNGALCINPDENAEYWEFEASRKQVEDINNKLRMSEAVSDALAAALPSLQYNRSISDKAEKLYLDAVAALNAYRGEK